MRPHWPPSGRKSTYYHVQFCRATSRGALAAAISPSISVAPASVSRSSKVSSAEDRAGSKCPGHQIHLLCFTPPPAPLRTGKHRLLSQSSPFAPVQTPELAPVHKSTAPETSQGGPNGGIRLVSLDGSTLDVADEPDNDAAFGRPGAGYGESAFSQIRFVSLVENGTHVLFGSQMSGCATGDSP